MATLTIEDLEKLYKETSEYKDKVENEYFKILGKLQMLRQQIAMLQEKEKKESNQEPKKEETVEAK